MRLLHCIVVFWVDREIGAEKRQRKDSSIFVLKIKFDVKFLQESRCLVSWWTTTSLTLTSSTCLTSPVTTLFQHEWSPDAVINK